MSEKDKELYKIIGSILRSARENLDLTNVEVSKRLKARNFNVSDTSLRRYESGERAVKIDLLMELCKIFDLDYQEVMKEAQIKRLKVLDPSYQVFSKKDPNPILTTYGEDVVEIIDLYSKLNDAGKAQALTQLRMIVNTPEFIQVKAREGLG